MSTGRISILIVTKNRSQDLDRCLSSLELQTTRPWEIVVVDNGSTDNTKKVTLRHKRSLPVRYTLTTAKGYPKVYNYGLQKTLGGWTVFLDDDCFVPREWYERIIQAIDKNSSAVIQGKTISWPEDNLYAEIMGDHYTNWVRSNTVNANRLRTFDNKNLCVPRRVVERYGAFNEALIYGSEDIELGIRYATHGVPILYEPSIIAYHHERDTLAGFVSQHVRIARSEALLDRQLTKHDKVGVSSRKRIILYLQSFTRREIVYVRRGQILNFLKTPVLYFLLAAIRIWTYYTTVWSVQK